ncbi:hypothetical protein [Actinomycetospora flava]|uniref:FhuF-like iron-sulfur protein n=1 Tax=Actinomycetospora flava TaxID=3129232 RepID=A0ABU8MBL6_9PSEU
MPDDGLEILVPGRDAVGDRFRAWVGTPASPEWLPATRLFGAGLDDALADVRAARGTDSDAVAGSLLLESYAQRVVPPALAARVLAGRSVSTAPDALSVRCEEGRVREVAFAPRPRDGPALAGFDAVVATLHRRTRAGRRVLAGAVAHAVAVTYVHLSWPEPDHARHLDDARRVLADAGLADLVRVEAAEVDGEPWLYADRRTCCLAFRTHRAAGPSFCATCPIVPESDRRRSFTDAVASYGRRHAES